MQTPHTRGTLSLAIIPKMVDGGGVALAFAFAAVAASVRHSCGKRALEKKEM
jgi:hypothetical protein